MADKEPSVFSPPSPEQRRVAVGQYERAQQVTATGDFDYGIQLLLTCCKLDPANLIYRRALRQVEKKKFKNNLRGSKLALLTTAASKAKIKAAKHTRDYLKVLEHGEEVLTHNPWDTGAQLEMAEAAATLGLLDLAVWTLEQARQKDPKDVTVNRGLARLYEKRGNFNQAIQLWDLVRESVPTDIEAGQKLRDLAASETIARGQYEHARDSETSEAAPAGAAPPRRTPAPGAPRPGGEVKRPGAPAAPQRQSPGVAAPGSGEVKRPAVPPSSQAPAGSRDRLTQEADALKERIQADPTNANAYLHLASLYRRADRFDEARAVLDEGLGPTGNHFDLSTGRADLEIESFRRDLAVAEEKLRQQPEDAELRSLRDRLRKEINTREADLFRQKADRYPTEKIYRFELGVRLMHLGQIDEAIRELQPLRTDTRFQWRALAYLGYCFKNRKNWRLAQRNFEDALKSLPPGENDTRKDILFQLAQGCAEAGDLKQAVDLANELANIDFGYRDISRLLDEWQTRLEGGS